MTRSKEDIAKKRQSNLIERLKKKETIMKWALIAAAIIILLLLLYIGYATDLARGLKTTSGTPVSSSLDSASTPAGENATSNNPAPSNSSPQGSSSTSTNTPSGGGNTPTPSGGGSTSTTTNNTSETTNNSSTTNNSTTTNNPTPTSPSSTSLLNIFADAKVGDTLDTIVNRALAEGIAVDCSDLLLIRTCTLSTADGVKVQIRGLLSNGLVTSVLRLL